MHPKSLELFEQVIEKPFEEQEAFMNESLSEKNVPNYEMATLLFYETKKLLLIYQRGVIDGMKKNKR